MNTVQKTLRLNFVPVSLALALTVTQGHAGDAKTYPGSMGVRYDDANPTFSTIENPTSSPMYVYLPVINDSIYGKITKSEVRVVDHSEEEDIWCELTSMKRTSWGGWDGFTGGRSTSRAWGPHLQSIDTGKADTGSGWDGPSYHEYINCRLPPNSGHPSSIVSYYVREE